MSPVIPEMIYRVDPLGKYYAHFLYIYIWYQPNRCDMQPSEIRFYSLLLL